MQGSMGDKYIGSLIKSAREKAKDAAQHRDRKQHTASAQAHTAHEVEDNKIVQSTARS